MNAKYIHKLYLEAIAATGSYVEPMPSLTNSNVTTKPATSDDLDDELDLTEMSATGDVAGFETKFAFSKNKNGGANPKVYKRDGMTLAKKINEAFTLQDLEHHIDHNRKDILANMQHYGWKKNDIKKIRNYYDLAHLLDVDTRDLQHVDLQQYAESTYELLFESKQTEFKKLASTMHIKESLYKVYKEDESATPRRKVNEAIQKVNSHLFQIEHILRQNLRLKQEANVQDSHYWDSTKVNFRKINEKLGRICNTIKNF